MTVIGQGDGKRSNRSTASLRSKRYGGELRGDIPHFGISRNMESFPPYFEFLERLERLEPNVFHAHASRARSYHGFWNCRNVEMRKLLYQSQTAA